jgi:hypothetical protein
MDIREYKKIKVLLLVLPLVFSVLIAADVSKSDEIDNSISKEERIFGLTVVYDMVKHNFAYFENVPDINWDQMFLKYLPEVERQQSMLEYYRVLQSFTAHLKDGHTDVQLPNYLGNRLDKLPIRLEKISNDLKLTDFRPRGVFPGGG